MSAQVNVLTFLSKTHIEKGRYAVSVDVAQRKKADSVKKKRKTEEQVYIEHESVVGSCSPEFELTLKNKKCDIQFSISGALKPQSVIEEGEDILEYNSSLTECRRLLTLVPTYDPETDGNATIKFKVDGKVKHTVTIHDVPVIRTMSTRSSEASFVDVRGCGAERQTSVFSSSVSSQSLGSLETSCNFSQEDDDSIDAGTVREIADSASGEGHWSNNPNAVPFSQREFDQEVNQAFGNMAIGNSSQGNVPPGGHQAQPVGAQAGPGASAQIGSSSVGVQQAGPVTVPQPGPQYVPPLPDSENAYDKILCNGSLNTLSYVLSPSDASRLLIGLRVPNSILEINRKNNPGDVVAANYQSFLHWRSQKSSTKQEHEAINQYLYEDLLVELQDIGRKDIKVVIKQALEGNKKLEKSDFSRL